MAIAQNKQFYADFLQGFDEVVVLYTLCADLYWGTWAVYQAGTSTIDFDYLTYAKLRFDTYFMFKKLLVP
jgi:ethanolamine kinase